MLGVSLTLSVSVHVQVGHMLSALTHISRSGVAPIYGMIALHLTISGTTNLRSMAVSFFNPTSNAWGSIFSTSSSTFRLLPIYHLSRCKLMSGSGFDLHLPNDWWFRTPSPVLIISLFFGERSLPLHWPFLFVYFWCWKLNIGHAHAKVMPRSRWGHAKVMLYSWTAPPAPSAHLKTKISWESMVRVNSDCPFGWSE